MTDHPFAYNAPYVPDRREATALHVIGGCLSLAVIAVAFLLIELLSTPALTPC